MLGRSKYSVAKQSRRWTWRRYQGATQDCQVAGSAAERTPQPLRPGARTLPPLPSEMHADER